MATIQRIFCTDEQYLHELLPPSSLKGINLLLSEGLNSCSPSTSTGLQNFKSSKQSDKGIGKYLGEYLILVYALIKTIKNLKLGRLKKFDPIVGENFCQIRAVKITKTYHACLESLAEKEMPIQVVFNQITHYFNKEISLNFLVDRHFRILLNKDEIYFVLAYLLTIVKKVKNKNNYLIREEKTKYKLLKNKLKKFEFLNLSNSFYKSLIEKLKRDMICASVQFVFDQQNRSLQLDNAFHLSNGLIFGKNNKIPLIPMFRGTNVILEAAANEGLLILIRTECVYRRCILFGNMAALYRYQKGIGYRLTEAKSSDSKKSVVVFRGLTFVKGNSVQRESEWKRQMQYYDPCLILKTAVANHPQYPNDRPVITNDPSLTLHKNLAIQWKSNTAMSPPFTPMHIYSAKNIPQLKYKAKHLLTKYHSVYLQYIVRKLWEDIVREYSFLKEDAVEPYFENSTIKFRYLHSYIRYYSQYISHGLSSCLGLLHHNIDYEIKMESYCEGMQTYYCPEVVLSFDQFDSYNAAFSRYPSDMLLDIATTLSNPTKFLLDHREHWGFHDSNIIECLMSIPENEKNQKFIKFIFAALFESRYSLDAKCKMLEYLENLRDPAVHKMIESWVIEFATGLDKQLKIHAFRLAYYFLTEAEWKKFFTIAFSKDVASIFKFLIQTKTDGLFVSMNSFVNLYFLKRRFFFTHELKIVNQQFYLSHPGLQDLEVLIQERFKNFHYIYYSRMMDEYLKDFIKIVLDYESKYPLEMRVCSFFTIAYILYEVLVDVQKHDQNIKILSGINKCIEGNNPDNNALKDKILFLINLL